MIDKAPRKKQPARQIKEKSRRRKIREKEELQGRHVNPPFPCIDQIVRPSVFTYSRLESYLRITHHRHRPSHQGTPRKSPSLVLSTKFALIVFRDEYSSAGLDFVVYGFLVNLSGPHSILVWPAHCNPASWIFLL